MMPASQTILNHAADKSSKALGDRGRGRLGKQSARFPQFSLAPQSSPRCRVFRGEIGGERGSLPKSLYGHLTLKRGAVSARSALFVRERR
jgi:hypothetical protein